MKNKKLWICLFSTLAIAAMLCFMYLVVIPASVTHTKLVNTICEFINRNSDFDIVIESPVLKTKWNSEVLIGARNIEVSKDGLILLKADNLLTSFMLNKLVDKKIVVNSFSIEYLYSDVNGLMQLADKNKSETPKESSYALDLYDSILDVKNAIISYSFDDDTSVNVRVENLYVDNTQKHERFLKFNIYSELKNKNKIMHFDIADNNKVIIRNKHLYINDCLFDINKSVVHINAEGSRQNGLNLNLTSKNFAIEDVTDILATNLIIANGSEILSSFENISGKFDFNINVSRSGINGTVNLNKAYAKLLPLAGLPVTVNKGFVKLTPETIHLEGFEGYYGLSSINKISIQGDVQDYKNTCATKITLKTAINNEFTENYLSKTIGTPITMIGKAGTLVVMESLNNKLDITIGAKLATGNDILVDGASLTPITYDRAIKADLHLVNNMLDIEDINYYIAQEIVRGSKVKPVLTLNGKVDLSHPEPFVRKLGFDIPNPLPSEFLNVLIGKKLFKGGKFHGSLTMINDSFPTLDGKMFAENIRIPSQRLYLKNGELHTDKHTIHLSANAGYKRSKIEFAGDIKNSLVYPIVIRNVDFSLDNLDVEKIIESFNQQVAENPHEISEDDDSAVTFDFNNLIIEKCLLKIKEGCYKEIKFANLDANLTLNNNVLDLSSNKFDIAEGTSAVNVNCDLNKHEYYLKLGVKDVNSDLISSTLLNLPKEISGKAKGIIELNTDDSLKLNGKIKFMINDGRIPKIGLVEYLMKFVSVFRNPIAMISPNIVTDMVNVPDGKFDKITGELTLKDNVVERMKIESTAPYLACLIIGRYNLDNSDASIRIYTKFSNKQKGLSSVLRNVSLNSLANKISLSSKTDSNYYAAELNMLPKLEADDKDCQVFLTTVDGDLEHNNFLSSLKKIK